jgi:hypothetical protein
MPSLTADFAALLTDVRRPGDFYVAGTTELFAPSLEVDGVGHVALPLQPAQAEQLIAAAEAAPYGRGEATLVDPAVRRSWQIGPDRVHIGGRHWPKTLAAILPRLAEGLGVSDPIEAEFYKLLVYDRGSFFVSHRDTEKVAGMFATLVVVLPSAFVGGAMLVRHGGREVSLDLRSEDPAEVAFAAFYADCVHEIRPVTEGFRLTLVYNVLRRGKGKPPRPPSYDAEVARMAELLQAWRASAGDGPTKLVYPLEHAYTPAELGFSALKGVDAAVAGVLAAAARQARCDLHLALLTIEESGPAEYSGYGSRRRGRDEDEDDEAEDYEVVEISNQSIMLSDWRRSDGAAAGLGTIPVEDEELSPPDVIEALEPDEQHFHEATGNEGASFERSYHRAALVLWPGDRINAVLSQAGLQVSLPYLDDLAGRWAAAGADRQSELWQDAHDLAGHMLAQWPTRDWYYHDGKTLSDPARMLVLLTRLGDTALIERFISEITAAGQYGKGDNAAVVAALERLPPADAATLADRIVAGTGAKNPAACANLLARAAAAWPPDRRAGLARAAKRLLAALPGDPAGATPLDAWRRQPDIEPELATDLLTGLGAIEARLADRALDHLLAWPKIYGFDAVLVPALRRLQTAPAGAAAPAIARLREACLAHLRARAAEPLAPPADWRRASALPCRCARCTELARFLDDPSCKTWIFKAAEADRRHVADTIKSAGCDLDAVTDRQGRPYRLVCTKNQASYGRRARQRKQDLADLAAFAD